MNTIQPAAASPASVTPSLQPNNAADQAGGFKDMLVNSIEHVNHMQTEADAAIETLFTGGDVNPAEVLTAVQKADLAFRLTMQMRNKVMDVYQEIKDIRI